MSLRTLHVGPQRSRMSLWSSALFWFVTFRISVSTSVRLFSSCNCLGSASVTGLLPDEEGQVSSRILGAKTRISALFAFFLTMTLTSVAPYSLSPTVGARFPSTSTTGPWSCTLFSSRVPSTLCLLLPEGSEDRPQARRKLDVLLTLEFR